MQMKKCILCAALVFLLASGCGTGGERIYSIPLGNGWFSTESWVVDRDGNEVRPKEENADYFETGLNDLATGETRYRYRMRGGKEIGGSNGPGRTIYRTDILDHTGKLVVDNVTDVYDVGPDRIALRRGFYIGLMDWDGSWVAKRKIFTGFIDD